MGQFLNTLKAIREALLRNQVDRQNSDKRVAGALDFICNICASANIAHLTKVAAREEITCRSCGSTLRFRSVVGALQQRLTGEIVPLTASVSNKGIRGIGMSDANVYAKIFAEKFDYTNSFYHQEPLLDVTKPDAKWLNQFDFVTSSDVMEHVAPPIDTAFAALRALLKPNGYLILSVPYSLAPNTVEHFPNLHDYEITGSNTSRTLRNVTADGQVETFTNLVFHGGDGATLEMRLFSEQGLICALEKAGFTDIKIHSSNFPEFGIINFDLFSLPISARAAPT
jgi:SAM-dependent methyltransferase